MCKYGRANASFGTEPDTAASTPSPSFLFRHARFVACELEVYVQNSEWSSYETML
jgi:hypothetical protein